jgi:hypothetical protein
MSKPVELLVVGRGKMRNAIIGPGVPGVEAGGNPWDNDSWNINAEPSEHFFHVAIHCGSGRQFPKLVEYCDRWKVPLIQASSSLKDRTGGTIPLPTSDAISFPLIKAPNLALPVVALFRVLPELGLLMKGLKPRVHVMESHQQSKTSAPITAQKLAGYFGAPPETVISERNPEVQEFSLGVPHEHLDGHAYHYLELDVCGVKIAMSTKINGREPYILGLSVVIQKIVEIGDALKPGIHELDQLMFC